MEELFGVDGARYLIARSFPTDNDSDVGLERFKETYNADLANNLGNLISRVNKLSDGFEKIIEGIELDKKFIELIDNCRFDEAIGLVFNKWIDASNILLNKKTPWKLEAGSNERKIILDECISNIQKAIIHLLPITPGLKDDRSILFPRIA